MTTRMLSPLVAGVCLAVGLAAGDDKTGPACCEEQTLKIGAVAYSPHAVTIFQSLRHYFAKNKMPVDFVLYSSYDALNEALAKSQVDVAWNTPLGHANFHQKAGASQTLVMRDVDVNCRVKLIARKDAGIAALSSLSGKTMVFGSCDAADSTVLPIYFLKKEGVGFDKVKILSLHDEVDERGNPCNSQHHVLAATAERGRGRCYRASSSLRVVAEAPVRSARTGRAVPGTLDVAAVQPLCVHGPQGFFQGNRRALHQAHGGDG